MPKLKNIVPKYRKHRASGQAIVTFNGRDIYLGPHGTKASKSEYDRILAEWLAGGRRSEPEPEAESVTVVEVIAAFLRHGKTHYRNKDGKPTGTLENFKLAFAVLLRHYGRKQANEFGPRGLEAIQTLLIQQGLSRRTINDRVGCIKRLFKWAVSKELVSPSVHHGLSALGGLSKGRSDAKESPPVLPVNDKVVERTLPHVSSVVRDMIKLQLLTGMRPAEVCIMRPGDVDISGEVWTYVPESHKTEHHGQSRIIAIGPLGQDILRAYLLRSATDYCFDPRDSEKKRRHERTAKRVIPFDQGNAPGTNKKRKPLRTAGIRYTPDSYRRSIHRACDIAFPPTEKLTDKELSAWQSSQRWSPNQLRHSAATKIRSQFGLESAQIFLGHSKADTTQIYAERDLQKAIEVARKIG